MQENENNVFSCPPSAEELMAAYAAAGKNDPTSPYYERILVRPKISIIRILVWVFSSLIVSFGVALATYTLADNMSVAMVSFFGVLALICLIFAKKLLIALVKIYQAVAPESLRKRCRYEPSCSVYMILAVEKYGFWKGFIKGLKRWGRCKPPNGGYDMP